MSTHIHKTKNASKTKVISIFGSTGSVGSKTFDIATQLGYNIIAITCNKNYKRAIEQAEQSNIKYIGASCEKSYQIIREHFVNSKTIDVLPPNKISELSRIPTDICCMSSLGQSYLYTYNAIQHTKRLAISSKEAIITLGNILTSRAKQYGTEIIPVDSEHNALFQCLQGTNSDNIKNLIITASGGSLLNLEEQDLKYVTINDALKHPIWNMGHKITIDSSTMINKAIEIIEAAILFNFDIEQINTIIHPQSIVHALITLNNNGQIASIYNPDMSLPISYALTYPYLQTSSVTSINLEEIARLDFLRMKKWQERSISIAKEAYKENNIIAFNAANDFAVNAFLSQKIKFMSIWTLIEYVLSRQAYKPQSIDDIGNIISECNIIADEFLKTYYS